jgi:hypothetical protein
METRELSTTAKLAIWIEGERPGWVERGVDVQRMLSTSGAGSWQ